MEKPSSAADSGGTDAKCNSVFIDTSLDTHLAIVVYDCDTVADLKKKIMYEHPLCFPDIGEINAHALKVKRKGHFYHLSDSMFVKSAFEGVSKSWFLSVDASRLQAQIENQHSGKPNSGIGLLSDGPAKRLYDVFDSSLPLVQREWHAKEKPSADFNPDSNCNFLSIDTNNRSDPEVQEKHGVDSNKHEDPIMHIGCDEQNFRNVIGDVQFSVSLEKGPETGSTAKKAGRTTKTESAEKKEGRTRKKRKEQSFNHALKENDASAKGRDKDASQQDTVVPDNSLVSEDKRPGGEVQMADVPGITWHAKEKPSVDFNPDSNCNFLSVDTNNSSDPEVKEKHEVDSKKKRKTRKKRKEQSFDHALEENDASAQEADKEISQHDIVVPDNSLVSEDKRPDGEVQMTDVLSNGTAFPGNRVELEKDTSTNDVISVQCHVSMEEASPSSTKENQKTVNNKNSSEEIRVLCNSSNYISGPGITISQSSLLDKQKGMNVTVDHVSSEILKDSHLLTSSTSMMKRKSPEVANQEVASVPNSAENDTLESSWNAVGSHDKDSERELVAPFVPGQVVQGTMISEPCSISVKDKLSIPVQEVLENNTVPHSLDVDMSVAAAGNAETTNDPPEAAAASALIKMGNSNELHTIEAEGNPPAAVQQGNDLAGTGVIVEPVKSSKRRKKSKKTRDADSQVTLGTKDPHTIETQGNAPVAVPEVDDLSKNTGVNEHGNVMVNDCQKFGSDQMVRVEEERELSQNNDPKTMSSIKCIPFDVNSEVAVTSDLLDTNDNVEPGESSKKRKKSAKHIPSSGEEIDVNSKGEVTSNLLDAKDIGEPGKPLKKKKKSKRTQDPVTVPQVTSGTEHEICHVIGTSLTEQHETKHNDLLSEKSGKEKGILVPSGENEESKAKTDNVIRNVLESLQDHSKNSEKAENKVEKSRKKNKRKQSSSAKSVPELVNEDENVSFKNVELEIDVTRELEVDASTILTKTKLAKTSTEHQLNTSNWKPENNAGVEADPLHNELNAKSSQVLSYQLEGNINPQSSLSKGEGDNLKHRPKMKLSEVSGNGMEAPSASKKSDKFNSVTKDTTRPNTVDAFRRVTRSSKNRETIAASNSSLESFNSIIPQSERVNSHQSQVAVRKKISNNDNGEVLNSSEHKKSLLATSGTIFNDNDWSSDDGGVDNLDASTKTSSDNSLSFDYSDGDSSATEHGFCLKRKEQRGNITKSPSSLNLGTILRSSSRYKAAKQTASQSQPEEFVPESQPNL